MTTFDDGKDDGALRTIGEVGSALGLKPHVLRYWEDQFPMLQPLKRSGNRRYYRPEDVALIETIDRLVNREGYTLKGAKAAIAEGRGGKGDGDKPAPSPKPKREAAKTPRAEKGTTAKPAADEADAAVPAEVVAQLKDIRRRLASALDD